ncbi:hypothetical protein Q4F19_06390 [Sphingomonas sp. BIUV-7]|uniref:Uncharacterized protein n=1 Tax=Sphingomonas natans TaxID=3063330 RepID=A0ABT8Y6R9_9SPHN|nr:hypothetical protein [Sphingomonas sp. BIUV-7]MDO6414004.1 hypothetical protein [Sphingomonas sp. BIUV-7]
MADPRNDADKTTGGPVVHIETPTPDETPGVPVAPSEDEDMIRDTAVQGDDED